MRTSMDSPRKFDFGLLQDCWPAPAVSRLLNLEERLGAACKGGFEACGDITGLCCIQA
jgi:hypothetical protein